MKSDLERLFGEIADRIPEDDTEFVFSSEVLPKSEIEVTSDQILIRRSSTHPHTYTQNRVDSLWLYTNKRTLRLLALLIFSKVFHSSPREIRLHLSHQSSDIRVIRLDWNGEIDRWWATLPDLESRPYRYTYWPSAVTRFPLAGSKIDPRFLPILALTNEEDSIGPSESDWASRNVLKCAGSVSGNILLARVLLDASLQQFTENELALETELGFGGAGHGSAELRIFLPGSLGWDDEIPS